jgi:hypothetical protein
VKGNLHFGRKRCSKHDGRDLKLFLDEENRVGTLDLVKGPNVGVEDLDVAATRVDDDASREAISPALASDENLVSKLAT